MLLIYQRLKSAMERSRIKALKEIQVETLLIRNKINWYRGILKLHAHDKKLQLSQATKLKSLISKKVTSLEVDVKKYREVIDDLKNENKRDILRALSDYREFYLAFSYLKPSEICATVYENCDIKRRLLDKLYCEKKRKLKQGIDLQIEHVVLSREFEKQSEEQLYCEQQRLVARLQQSITKHNSAKTIHSTYLSMLNILKKDALFFGNLADIIKEDQTAQCKQMLKVTVMGQLAAEDLDNIKQKYKRMTQVVLRNMKIREQMLSAVRCEVEDLWAYAQSLVRNESNHVLKKKDHNEAWSADKILENQLAGLKKVCNKVKEILLVRPYHDLFSRFETQSAHKTALLARLDTNLKNRDLLFSKKNHALQVLESLIYSIKIAEQYKANERDILEQLKIEKKKEIDLNEQKKALGKWFTGIRAALLSMSTMLLCLKHGTAATKKPVKDANKNMLKEVQLSTTADDKDTKENDVLSEIGEESDVLLLLSKISRKIGILFNMSNFELEQEKENKARNFYQTYMSHYTSKLIFGTDEEKLIGTLLKSLTSKYG
ncbi:uncharacterized protein LOC109861706 isoform X2 [Pseudomyrmex gracilis]|uniref:uncharacterized protein LOC109861706 isoform X2 n=1 Tax=Pseudomyrmex gracilis TaxID=219809 RepID=UPI000994C4A3|nr:uncharacterized protein LOC109861706 isoform X2 [Pseudomyrmex gracilis]